MGVIGFLILFLILILVVFPLISKRERVSRGTATEIRGLDGTALVFSDEGVSIFRHGEFRFFRKGEIEELSVKREGDIYRVVLKARGETFEVPVKEAEVQKLFVKRGERYDFSVPWLPVILGTTAPLLLFETLEHLENHVTDKRVDEEEENHQDTQRDFDLGVPATDYDYFDTGDWSDDDVEV